MAADARGLTAEPAIRIDGLTRRFGARRVLDDIQLTIEAGEFVALLGRSGSGKSTLLRALAGIDHDSVGGGSVAVTPRSSVLFQDARLLPWERVLDNVVLGETAADARDRGRAALAEVGLAARERDWPKILSGGEQQRVALARSLLREPELLLMDEPFSALDALTKLKMHALLQDLCRRHAPAVLLVTHDVDEALSLANRILLLDAGRLVVDRRIDLAHPRARSGAGFEALRREMLHRLGVA